MPSLYPASDRSEAVASTALLAAEDGENDAFMSMTPVTPASESVTPNSFFLGPHPQSFSDLIWACDPHRKAKRSASVLMWIGGFIYERWSCRGAETSAVWCKYVVFSRPSPIFRHLHRVSHLLSHDLL